MTEEVLSMTIGVDTAYQVWCSLEQLLPNTKENEAQLKNNLYALTKWGTRIYAHALPFDGELTFYLKMIYFLENGLSCHFFLFYF